MPNSRAPRQATLLPTADVQVGLLLAGERQFRQILGGCRRTYRHRNGLAADVRVHRRVEITGEIPRHRMRREEPSDHVGRICEREPAISHDGDRRLHDEPVQSVGLDEAAVDAGRDDETVRERQTPLGRAVQVIAPCRPPGQGRESPCSEAICRSVRQEEGASTPGTLTNLPREW